MAMTTKTILLVDDEEKLLNSISRRLDLMGVDSIKTKSGFEAIEVAKTNRLDLAIVDLKMPGMDGLVTIAKLKEIQPDLRTVLLTGYGEEKVRQAAEALDAAYFEKDEMGGLWDFIKKFNADGKVIVIRPSGRKEGGGAGSAEGKFFFDGGQIEIHPGTVSASESARLYEQYEKNRQASRTGRLRLIGETAAMRELRKNIQRSASLDCNVMIRGETGTGKELAARAIHDLSSRKDKPFLAVNCGCLTNELLFEELFGEAKPNAEGAGGERTGLSAVKAGGTLLLDQIEDMPKQMQLQLLRMIDSSEGAGIGTVRRNAADVRIISAVNSGLRRLVEEDKFRKDLFYRLNVFELCIPPLRERGDDIPVLAAYFLDMFAKEFGKKIQYISDDVMSSFRVYKFPGNVRELKHIIERAVILADGDTVKRKHLPERFQPAERPAPAKATESTAVDTPENLVTLAEMEAKYILKVLEACGGNKTRTSEVLGISRAALWRKLRNINEDREESSGSDGK